MHGMHEVRSSILLVSTMDINDTRDYSLVFSFVLFLYLEKLCYRCRYFVFSFFPDKSGILNAVWQMNRMGRNILRNIAGSMQSIIRGG